MIILAACNTQPPAEPEATEPAAAEPEAAEPAAAEPTAETEAADGGGEPLVVVATTGHIADTLMNLGGGELFEVESLLGPGIDPHTYVPTEGDIELFETADIIFYNGVRLEAQMDELLEQIGERDETVVVGVGDRLPEDQLLEWEPENNLPYDPHIWNDMQLWMEVTQVMADTLAAEDPANADEYAALNEVYQAELEETHEYVAAVAESIPEENRIIISGHDAFNYFGRTYDFQVEAVQGISTETEASAADIQNLVDTIVANEVPAIFAENIVSPDTIEAVQAGAQAEGVDVQIGGELYSDALGEEGSEGETYIGLMRYNIDTIAGALGGTPGLDPAAEDSAAEESAFAPVGNPVVNVYSARHYGAVEEVMERFTAETGIEVLISQGSTQSLVERILAEGEQSPADAVITIDGGSIELLANEGVLATVDSEIIAETIPENLRDPEGQWVALSQRVRTLVYNPANVGEEEIPTTYADLAEPQWADRLCLRPASHIYTIALVAGIIANQGEEEARRIVNGWVANNPTYINSDTRILETMEAGGCDAGITNHYYLGRIRDENPSFPIRIVWANQETTGVHRNVVAMGVLASARNKENAITLMEWLATEGQGAASDTISGGNHEFPANPDAEVHPVIAEFGAWQVDPLPLAAYGTNQAAALELLAETGYGFDETVASN
ncbi:MAG: metal ABC transporter solute-binding protein, Zn/Mn family [Chloroflexaceae bacterium]